MTSDSNPTLFPPHGYLLDGQSANRRLIRLFMRPDGFRYQTQDGKSAVWPYDTIDWALSKRDIPGELRLSQGGDHDAWLVIKSPKAIAAINTAYQIWHKQQGFRLSRDTRTILRTTATSFAILLALWFLWPYGANWLAQYVPQSFRSKLGDMTYNDIMSHTAACHSQAGDAALADIEKKLAASEPRLREEKVEVINLEMVNAFTLPDNRVVITRGLVDQAQSGDEVAGVMAHEFGHVLHNDVMRRLLRRGLVKLVLQSLGMGSTNSVSGVADTFVGNSFSREDEANADATGLTLLRDAKISTHGFGSFFTRLEKKSGSSRFLTYMSDHPAPSDRAAASAAVSVPDAQPALTDDQFQALKKVCE